MRSSTQSAKNHWISVGRRAKASKITLSAILTKNSVINEWIRQGFNEPKVK